MEAPEDALLRGREGGKVIASVFIHEWTQQLAPVVPLYGAQASDVGPQLRPKVAAQAVHGATVSFGTVV